MNPLNPCDALTLYWTATGLGVVALWMRARCCPSVPAPVSPPCVLTHSILKKLKRRAIHREDDLFYFIISRTAWFSYDGPACDAYRFQLSFPTPYNPILVRWRCQLQLSLHLTSNTTFQNPISLCIMDIF